MISSSFCRFYISKNSGILPLFFYVMRNGRRNVKNQDSYVKISLEKRGDILYNRSVGALQRSYGAENKSPICFSFPKRKNMRKKRPKSGRLSDRYGKSGKRFRLHKKAPIFIGAFCISYSFSGAFSFLCRSWRSMPTRMETRLIASQTIAPTDT